MGGGGVGGRARGGEGVPRTADTRTRMGAGGHAVTATAVVVTAATAVVVVDTAR